MPSWLGTLRHIGMGLQRSRGVFLWSNPLAAFKNASHPAPSQIVAWLCKSGEECIRMGLGLPTDLNPALPGIPQKFIFQGRVLKWISNGE